MQSKHTEDGVRERLIISGINELFEHGITDFSLRRTASRAQVSCAAPYRHFKDKDEMISEIVKYITSKWSLLCKEIESSFSSDRRRLAIEVAVATLLFWLGNPNFRSILLLNTTLVGNEGFDAYLISTIASYAEEICLSDSESRDLISSIRSAVYGTVMLTAMDNLTSTEEITRALRKALDTLLL